MYNIPANLEYHLKTILYNTEEAYIGGSIEDYLLLGFSDHVINDVDVFTYSDKDLERLLEHYGEPLEVVKNKKRASLIGDVSHLYKFKDVDIHYIESSTYPHEFMITRYKDMEILHHTLQSKKGIARIESEWFLKNNIELGKGKSIERILKTENKLL